MSRRDGPSAPLHADFSVKVRPRAARTEIVSRHEGTLEVRIAAPPVDDAANDELIRFVAKELGVGRTSVQIVRGAHSRHKLVRVTGIDPQHLETWLSAG